MAGRRLCLSPRCRGFLFYPRIAVIPYDDSRIVAEFSDEHCVPQTANTNSPVRVAREGPENFTGVIGDGDKGFVACIPFAVEVRGAKSYGSLCGVTAVCVCLFFYHKVCFGVGGHFFRLRFFGHRSVCPFRA